MTKRDGGQLVVECLKNFGATKAFGVPGESYLPILNALHDTRGELDFITCRQEGGAAFMAAAWGKLTGEPGICMVTRGPGATNASIGVHTAKQDSVPMILLVGQVSTDHLGREAFQEVDYGLMFRDLAKWVVQIDKVDRIPEILSRAWNRAISGRPGPVVVVLPEDVLTDTSAAAATGVASIVSAGEIAEALATLETSKRPVMVLGQRLTGTAQIGFQAFCERHDLPVVAASRCNDAIDNHSPAYVGEAGVGMPPHVRRALAEADLLAFIGGRLDEMTTGAFDLVRCPTPNQQIIQLSSEPSELGKLVDVGIFVHADPSQVAWEDLRLTSAKTQNNWRDECRQAHLAAVKKPKTTTPVNMAAVTAHLQTTLPPDAIVTNGAGNFAFWPNKLFQYGPRQRLLAPISGAMGFGLPAAIAAKVHDPSRTVVCFAGDGDFQMTCQELATARQHGACPIILLINNGRYGTIRMHQEREYPGRVSGTDMWNPDFVALAQAYGFHAEKIERTQDFAKAFERAVASKTGALLELIVEGQ